VGSIPPAGTNHRDHSVKSYRPLISRNFTIENQIKKDKAKTITVGILRFDPRLRSRKEFPHRRGTGRISGQFGDAQSFKHQAKSTLMLVKRH
jgi:hypothetical protein